jgi:hypothetical protein
MQRVMLKSKIHRATVTDSDLHYVGSLTIDPDLLEAADIREHEQVHVVDVDNGARFETYTMAGKRGAGAICVNGPASSTPATPSSSSPTRPTTSASSTATSRASSTSTGATGSSTSTRRSRRC